MEVEVRGLNSLKNILRRLNDASRRLILAVTKSVHEEAVALAPVRTGFLRDRISMEVERDVGRVVSEAPYSAYVEYGTRPHFIYPRNARALRFEVGGRTIFAGYARHPGARGRFFMRRALENGLRRLGQIVSRVFK